MAKIKGPLHSATASGAFGSAIIFGASKARNAARNMVNIPRAGGLRRPPPATPAQQQQRAAYSVAVTSWNALTPAQKAAFAAYAQPLNLTAYQAAIGYFLQHPPTIWDSGATTWDTGSTTWDATPPT